jgi:hypothetical protein
MGDVSPVQHINDASLYFVPMPVIMMHTDTMTDYLSESAPMSGAPTKGNV